MAAVPSARPAVGVALPAAGSDPDAAHGLYERNHARVLRFCRRRLRTPEDAEDATQTTFAHAVRALQRGVVPQVEAAWLLTIARNVCRNRWEAARRRGRVEVARDPQLLAEVPAGGTDGADELIELGPALGRLTDQQRRAILLREWQGLSYLEIGEELGLSQEAVEALIFRARRALARDLRGERAVRPGLDFGSLLATLKSLVTGGGAAVKVAALAAAVATAGAIAGPPLAHRAMPQGQTPGHGPAGQHARPATARLARTPAPVRAHARSERPAQAPAQGPSAAFRSEPAPRRPARRPEPRDSAAVSPTEQAMASSKPAPASSRPTAAPNAAPPPPPALPAASPPPAPPPAPVVSTPPVPPPPVPVDVPSVPAPSLPAVPDLPLDPPPLPPTPTVSTPKLP